MLADMGDLLDGDMRADFVEGQTSLHEVMELAVRRMLTIEAMRGGIKATMEQIKSRDHRLEEQLALLRTRLAVAMEIAGKTDERLQTPLATVSYRKTAPQVQIVDESKIPSEFFKRPDPKLDKVALKDALKALKPEEFIPGAVLDNGGSTVSLYTK